MEPVEAAQEIRSLGRGPSRRDSFLLREKSPLGYLDSSNQKAKNVIRRAYGYRMTLPGDLQSLFPYFHACIDFLFRFFDREV